MHNHAAQYGEPFTPKAETPAHNSAKIIRKNKKVAEIKVDNGTIKIPNVDYVAELEADIIRLSASVDELRNHLNKQSQDNMLLSRRLSEIENFLKKGY